MTPFHPNMADSADSLALDVPNRTLDILHFLPCSSLAFPISVERHYHSPRCSSQNQAGITNIPLISIFTSKPYWNNDYPVFICNTWVRPPPPLKELWQVTCSTLKSSCTWSRTELANDILIVLLPCSRPFHGFPSHLEWNSHSFPGFKCPRSSVSCLSLGPHYSHFPACPVPSGSSAFCLFLARISPLLRVSHSFCLCPGMLCPQIIA